MNERTKELGAAVGFALASGALSIGLGLFLGRGMDQRIEKCIEQPMYSLVRDMDLDGIDDIVVVPNPAFKNAEFSPKPLVFYGSRTDTATVSYNVECSCPEYEQ